MKGQHRLTVQLDLGASGQDYPAEKRGEEDKNIRFTSSVSDFPTVCTGPHEAPAGYQRRQRVALHVKSFQDPQASILQQLPGERIQVPAVQKEAFVALLLGEENGVVELRCHLPPANA